MHSQQAVFSAVAELFVIIYISSININLHIYPIIIFRTRAISRKMTQKQRHNNNNVIQCLSNNTEIP